MKRILGLLLATWFGAMSARADAGAIENVLISTGDGAATIEVRFSCAHRYIMHAPEGAAARAEIVLERLERCGSAVRDEPLRESTRPAGREAAGLLEVEYQARDSVEAQLVLQFERPVRFGVQPESDPRRLRIFVATDQPAPMAAPVTTGVAPPAAAASRSLTDEQLATLIAEARAGVLAKDYPRVVQLCTKLLAEPEHANSQEAQELLGLARERNGQFAHAVAEYRRYLERYPQGEGAERVRQRLAALTTAGEAPKAGIGTVAASDSPARWDAYGGFAQYYRRDAYDFDGQGSTTTQSSVLSDADFVVRRRGERVDFSTRATVGHLWDLLGEDDGTGDQGRIYNLYADFNDQQWDAAARLGRQTLRSSGVLGRFDGAHLSWQMRPATRLNLVTGYPVYLPSDSPDSTRVFYGVSADFTGVFDGTDASLFYNTQEVDGIEDREALGGELRYFDERRSLVAMIDYDIGYSELNALMALGNWTFENRININAMVDYRHSPFLTTENALIGQSVSAVDDLLRTLTEDEIRQLAADRSAEMQTYGLGIAAPVSERFQVSADVTVTQLEGTPASGGVPEYPDLGTEYYYYVSLIGSNLFVEGDVSILGLRYTDGDTAETATLYVDTRYPMGERLRINPRLALSLRQVAAGDADQWLARPALRLFYRMAKRWQFEMDIGGEWGSSDTSAGSTDTTGWYVYAGYRADF